MNNELWKIQKQFTEKFWNTKGGMPNTNDDKELTKVTKDYALHIIAEVTEVVQELPWKMHRTIKDSPIRTNVLEELVDILKFTLGLVQCWGFSWEELENEFRRKSAVVDQRFDQEQSLSRLRDQPCFLVDIDGVLTDYPRCFFDWLLTVGSSKEAYESLDLVGRKEFKKEYRQSGVKENLPVLPGAKDLLEAIHAAGFNIILITMRPYAEHYRIYPDTLAWLAKNGLRYDAIVWAKDKGLEALQNFKNIILAIDDEDKNIELYLQAKIEVIKVVPPNGTQDFLKSDVLKAYLGTLNRAV